MGSTSIAYLGSSLLWAIQGGSAQKGVPFLCLQYLIIISEKESNSSKKD